MFDSEPTPRPFVSAEGAFAAFLVAATMGLLYWRFSGDSAPDWFGYGQLYDDEGGWLLRTGREPGFIWLLSQARAVFGTNGYVHFRFSLFCVFTAFSMWLAYRAPNQGAVAPISPIAVALILVMTFLLKGLVQIREGIAFLFIAGPMLPLFGLHKKYFWYIGLSTIVAALIHAATAIFFFAWLSSIIIFYIPDKIITKKWTQWGIFLLATGLGIVLALTVLQNLDAIYFFLQDFGVDRHADLQVGFWKYVYWSFNGIFVFVARDQLIKSLKEVPRFAFSYATAIGTVLLPVTYASCLTLILIKFPMASVTSMSIRLFFTTIELTLIITMIRGGVNFTSLAMVILMVGDRARLLSVTP